MNIVVQNFRVFGAGLVVLLLAACGDDELILPGEREAVRPKDETVQTAADQSVPALQLPPVTRSAEWTHLNAVATHVAPHAEFGTAPARKWGVSIGTGADNRGRITSHPVVADNRIFTLDARSRISAVSVGGDLLWALDITPPDEIADQGFGGGLAFEAGTLYATSGFGEVLAIDPATGEIRWRTQVDAAIRAVPAVSGNVVAVVSRDDVAYGVNSETGDLIWRVQGVGLGAGLLGGSGPAIRGPVTVLPFRSGEVIAVLTRSGRRVWSAAVSGGRRGFVRAQINDITGDPVIDDDIVYAANQAGRLVSLDRRSGKRNWTAQEGSYGPVLPVGNSIFLVSDASEVIRIIAETGEVVWRQPLPEWSRPDKRRDAIPHFGPVLASGRLLIASGDGKLRSFDPATGAPGPSVDIPGGAASAPAIANGVLYVLSQTGDLHAFQ